jgi:hypothetical protein
MNKVLFGIYIITLSLFHFQCTEVERNAVSSFDVYYLDSTYVNLNVLSADTLIGLKGMYVKGYAKPADGIWNVFYDYNNSQKAYMVTVVNGRTNGLQTRWYRNGNKKWEGMFIDYAHHGLYRQWYQSGQLEKERSHKEPDIERTWYETGEVESETKFVDRIALSKREYFESGGQLREIYYEKNDDFVLGYIPVRGSEFNEVGDTLGNLIFECESNVTNMETGEIYEIEQMTLDSITE